MYLIKKTLRDFSINTGSFQMRLFPTVNDFKSTNKAYLHKYKQNY